MIGGIRWCAAVGTLAGAGLFAACAARPAPQPVEAGAVPADTPLAPPAQSPTAATAASEPVIPPRAAMLAGLLPLRSIGADTFRLRYPTYDGRGVIIGVLDSGLDPGAPGLRLTTTGRLKLLDLRDFSGEGRVALAPVRAGRADTIRIGEHRLTGFGRVARLASGPFFAGLFREQRLGSGPSADVNGNGHDRDTFPVLVARASSGWIMLTDSDGDGALDDERPLHDFAVGGETFSYRRAPNAPTPGPMTIAVNLAEDNREPMLDLVFDNSSHGTHVAGIAAGRNLFGVEGFDGVAPGAQVLGLKISDNSRGVVSVTGSMLRAMNYAADYAAERNLPLVLNMSFGVGNEIEGSAAIDSIVNEFALKHPDVLFVISAGNDGPGLSTVWFPGSAEYALSVCALFPGVFAEAPAPGVPSAQDVVGWWSARGGEVAKPDVCAPGVAFSNVPPWRAGEEISIGTSMAAPQIAGAAALLQSAMRARGLRARAIDLARALMNTATRPEGATWIDVGAGVPNVTAALNWLLAAHRAGVYSVRALPDGGNSSTATAAFRRGGLQSPADTIQRFVVSSMGGQPAARLLLQPDVRWLDVTPEIDLRGEPVTITVTYDYAALREPGTYVGTVYARAASDTLAGPLFELVSTIVVPQDLSAPFRDERLLAPGQAHRYFFRVDEGTGGLAATLRVTDPEVQGTLYLFEPNGQPYRGQGNVAVGGQRPSSGAIQLAVQDVIPGVYEAVVVAPPTQALSYAFGASLPDVAVATIDPGPKTLVRNVGARSIEAVVTAEAIGIARPVRVEGASSAAELLVVQAPPWAAEMIVDVRFPVSYWHSISDFGITVFDSSGTKLSDGSLGYAFDRHRVPLDSVASDELTIELSPAAAHLGRTTDWFADVRVAFVRKEGVTLLSPDSSAHAQIRLERGEAASVAFVAVPEQLGTPAGYQTLIEVEARTAAGRSVHRAAVGSS